jgi:hypothetical protein
LVRPDPTIGFPNHLLGNTKRLCFSNRLLPSLASSLRKKNPVPPSYLVDQRLPRAGSSPSLQPHYRTFNTTTG